MLVDEQESSVNPSAGSKHPQGIWIHYWSSSSKAAAVTQHLPQGNWPDFRKGPPRPKMAARRDSRGIGVTAGGEGEDAERSSRGEGERVCKQQVTLHEKRKEEAKWKRGDPQTKPQGTKRSSDRKHQISFPNDTALLQFWPPEGSCIPKILWKMMSPIFCTPNIRMWN